MCDLLSPRRNKRALPRTILTSGLFFTGISASYAALFPVESFPLPGKSTFLYQGDEQLIYAVYHKTDRCPEAVEDCSSYAVIDENNMLYGLNAYQCKINKITLKGATSDQPGWGSYR